MAIRRDHHVWTKDDFATLRRMWAAGMSGADIGAAIGVSSSSALNKAWELGLPNRRGTMPPKPVYKAPPKPKFPINGATASELRGPAWDALPGTTPADLEHMTGCKWAVGGGHELFCNAPKQPGSPYCPTHHAIAYRPIETAHPTLRKASEVEAA